MKITSTMEKKYEGLSPFELKNKLIDMATAHHEKMMLNAGRGNPNWVATTPRQGFFQLGLFAVEESKKVSHKETLGGIPVKDGINKRFEAFLNENTSSPGIDFLRKAYSYVIDTLKIDAETFISEMVDAIIADHYPTPDRMLTCAEEIVHKYLEQEMCANNPPQGKFLLFATEGGTAAMDYIFSSLMENKLLHKGDKIAIGTPIFTPYIEIPRLNDYEFVELNIEQDENSDWQYPSSEIDKLLDPKVKAFFLVNPSNPTSVSIHKETLDKIADIVKTKRKDLILLTDDVYGTFVNGFRSLAAVAPENTILVYSFSKYFGATGWRLGVIGIHEDNVFDKAIAALPEKDRTELHNRYASVEFDPDHMKLVDRMVADSRSVALHHTAGLSTPQQVIMTLFALSCLIDKDGTYKKHAQEVVTKRFTTLYAALGMTPPSNEFDAHYYTTIDIPTLAKDTYGKEFADFLLSSYEPIDFVMRLAEEKSIVLMDGGGFDAPKMSIRVSLANLDDSAYEKIGKGVRELLDKYYKHWQPQQNQS